MAHLSMLKSAGISGADARKSNTAREVGRFGPRKLKVAEVCCLTHTPHRAEEANHGIGRTHRPNQTQHAAANFPQIESARRPCVKISDALRNSFT